LLPSADAAYLAGLNDSFGGWGSAKEFAWWYRRPVDGLAADLLTVQASGELVAGMAICWRRAVRGDGEWLVGILSGAWTSRQHRRRGCFSELMAQAARRASERNAAALLAFTAPTRGTVPVLERVKAFLQPTWGVASPPAGSRAPLPHAVGTPTANELLELRQPARCAGLGYGERAFLQQARLDRPEAHVLEAGRGAWAAATIEGATLQVWSLVGELERQGRLLVRMASVAAGAGLGLRAFTTDAETAAVAAAAGLQVTRNHLFVLPAAGSSVPPELSTWDLQALDRA